MPHTERQIRQMYHSDNSTQCAKVYLRLRQLRVEQAALHSQQGVLCPREGRGTKGERRNQLHSTHALLHSVETLRSKIRELRSTAKKIAHEFRLLLPCPRRLQRYQLAMTSF